MAQKLDKAQFAINSLLVYCSLVPLVHTSRKTMHGRHFTYAQHRLLHRHNPLEDD